NIGIIGEALLEGLFEDGKKGMAEFLDFLRDSDGLKQWATETGESIREFANTVVGRFKDLKSWWDSLSDSTQELTKKIALFGTIGAVAIDPVITIIGKVESVIGTVMAVVGKLKIAFMIASKVIVAALGSLTWPIVAIIAAIAAVAAAVYFYWEPISEFFVELWQTISEIAIQAWKALWEFLQPIIQAIHDFIVEMFTKVKDFWNQNG